MIKYPNGLNKTYTKNTPTNIKNATKANLGIDFEDLINHTNKYYLEHNIACIYKKPTPIQIVKVNYPSRNKAKIVEAYYKTPSTTDYNGIYKGKYIDFEAKSTKTNSFPFSNIYEHQIKHLKTVSNMGGISFLIIQFSLKNEIYLLPTIKLVSLYNNSLNGGRKSIPYSYFQENAILVNINKINILDYLQVINSYYNI